ncbi:MAG: MopE-related protein [Myxococcota bacterium]
MLWVLATSRAAVLDVCPTGCTHSTIAAAVTAANAGDTVEVGPGTYVGSLVIDKSITVVATGGPTVTTIEPGATNETVTIDGVDATLEGFTVVSGLRRAVLTRDANATVRGIVVRDATGQNGVGVTARDNSVTLVEGCVFEDLVATGRGGALYAYENADLTVVGGRCTNVSAALGGCVAADGAGTVMLRDLEVTGATATTHGGSVYAHHTASITVSGGLYDTASAVNGGHLEIGNGGTLLVEDATFMGGASNRGGALRTSGMSSVTVQRSTFVGNTAVEDGGAIYALGAMSVSECELAANEALIEGGAMYVAAGNVQVDRSSFRGNQAASGGAMSVASGTMVGTGLELVGNTASGDGGAITSFGATDLRYSWVCGNAASEGGALSVTNSTTSVTGSVLHDNSASVAGGGVHTTGGALALDQVDVVANRAPSGGGLELGGPLDATHAVFAASQGYAVVSAGSVTIDWSAWFDNTPADLGGALVPADRGANLVEADPQLRYSADGDCDNDDFVPPSTSPLVDAGDPALTDADGTRRDIGAFGGDADGFPDADGDGAPDFFDCAPTDGSVFPGATEDCTDGVDNDCNGLVDDCGSGTWYTDADGDGFGDPASPVSAVTQPAGTVSDATDCDDTLASVSPAGTEVCNGRDDDCNGLVDDTPGDTWYADDDGDGYGAGAPQTSCDPPPGAVSSSTDCDDTDPDVNPGATEVWYDGVDDDCDGNDDDQDGDGVPATEAQGDDCDDLDPTVYPGAVEVPDDGIDQDCSSVDATTSYGVAGKRGACGCSGVPAPAGVWTWAGLLVLALRRRAVV